MVFHRKCLKNFDTNRHMFSHIVLLKIFQEFMVATKPANEDESEAKLRWAFRMYDTDSSGEYLTTMNALLMLHNGFTYLTTYKYIFLFCFPSFYLKFYEIFIGSRMYWWKGVLRNNKFNVWGARCQLRKFSEHVYCQALVKPFLSWKDLF